MYENVDCKYNKFWVPLMWANSILVQARKEERIESDWGLRMIIEQLADFRDKCSQCFVYDWITIPLIYTQVVTLAVYTFFAACLIGRQFLDPVKNIPGYEYDFYVPIFTLLQFFFYVGWLKVAEQLINPFGEDDDDFDINWLIDRHTAVGMTLVDQIYGKHPTLVKDVYFNETVSDLPYTEASLQSKKPVFLGSTYNLAVPSFQEQRFIPPDEAQRRISGSTVARSMLSLITGHKPHMRQHFQGSHDFLHTANHEKYRRINGLRDYFQIPNGNYMHHGLDTPERRISDESTFYPPKTNMSLWMSDLDLPEEEDFGRKRSHTDVGERRVHKAIRKRKISFPLALLRRLTRDSNVHSNSSGSLKAKHEVSQQSTKEEQPFEIPEYVPLRRAALTPDDARKPSVASLGRQRKVSFPLTLAKRHLDDTNTGSTSSVPGVVASHSKPSRFTIEQVTDQDFEDANNQYRRNAQKLEKAMAAHTVSRAPLLSAIEEGNTITSISQILTSESEDEDNTNAVDNYNLMRHRESIPEEDESQIQQEEPITKVNNQFIIPEIKIDEW